LTDVSLQVTFDPWWSSNILGLQVPIACNVSTRAPAWRIYLLCGIDETGSPWIICILCHQVLRYPSQHSTSSIAKHLLANALIAKLNKLTELEDCELTSTTVDETAFALLKRQGSCGVTIVRLEKKFIFDGFIFLIFTSLTATTLYTGSYGLRHYPISPRFLELLPHVWIGFTSHFSERYVTHGGTMFISCIAQRGSASIH
jgi:hypothetical protein